MASLTGVAATTGHAGSTPRPVDMPQLKGLDFGARYYSNRCGGDFFDAVTAGSRVIFLLTDIAGRRAETFPIAARVQSTFRGRARELFEAPDANESEVIAILTRDVNRALIEASHGVRFAPAFIGCYNLTLNILTYHNAGSLLAVFQDRDGIRILPPSGIPMGLFTHSTYEPAVLAFEPYARLLLVTKGITESRRGATTFGAERVRRILENSNENSASEICKLVLQEAHAFSEHPWSRIYDLLHRHRERCSDDLTAVTLIRPGHSSGDPAQ